MLVVTFPFGYAECHYVECQSIILLSVVVLNDSVMSDVALLSYSCCTHSFSKLACFIAVKLFSIALKGSSLQGFFMERILPAIT